MNFDQVSGAYVGPGSPAWSVPLGITEGNKERRENLAPACGGFPQPLGLQQETWYGS